MPQHHPSRAWVLERQQNQAAECSPGVTAASLPLHTMHVLHASYDSLCLQVAESRIVKLDGIKMWQVRLHVAAVLLQIQPLCSSFRALCLV